MVRVRVRARVRVRVRVVSQGSTRDARVAHAHAQPRLQGRAELDQTATDTRGERRVGRSALG